eukprot:1157396-Pelagomonas_calceolata.AAC.4
MRCRSYCGCWRCGSRGWAGLGPAHAPAELPVQAPHELLCKRVACTCAHEIRQGHEWEGHDVANAQHNGQADTHTSSLAFTSTIWVGSRQHANSSKPVTVCSQYWRPVCCTSTLPTTPHTRPPYSHRPGLSLSVAMINFWTASKRLQLAPRYENLVPDRGLEALATAGAPMCMGCVVGPHQKHRGPCKYEAAILFMLEACVLSAGWSFGDSANQLVE